MSTRVTVEIPITARAREYGYVIWRKGQDEEMHALLTDAEVVDICGATDQTAKRVDWKQRRIGITYSFTRRLSKSAKCFRLRKAGKRTISLEVV